MLPEPRAVPRALAALLLAALAVCASAPARAETWDVDRQATQVTVSWDHLGLARHSARAVDVRGQVQFSPTEPEAGSVSIVIRSSSLWTGVKELDDLIRSADFLDAARFPEIRFSSTGLTRTGDRTADLAGDLTIRDVTLPVVLKTTWNFTGEHPLAAVNPRYLGKWTSGFSASTEIKRSDFGIRRALPLIGDAIGITIEAEFVRRDETAAGSD